MSSSLSLSLSPLSPSPSLLNDLDFLVLRVFSKTCEFECFTGNEYAYRSELEGLHTYIHTGYHPHGPEHTLEAKWGSSTLDRYSSSSGNRIPSISKERARSSKFPSLRPAVRNESMVSFNTAQLAQ